MQNIENYYDKVDDEDEDDVDVDDDQETRKLCE